MKTAALFLAAILATVTAAQSQVAMVTIESKSSSSVRARDLSNQTVAIPINTPYTDSSMLSSVSGLYVTGAQGIPVDSVICTPFKNDNGTDPEGDAFSSTDPTTLHSVQLGSIVCITNSLPSLPSGLGGSSSFTTSVAPKTRNSPTTSSSSTCTKSVTTIKVPNTTPTQSSSTSTTTASTTQASQSASHNVGNSLLASSEFFAGLAIAGLGVAFVV